MATEPQLTSSEKTNKACYTMFTKWQATVNDKAAKEKTFAHYIQACIGGYPRQTKMKPSLLSARIRGYEKHCKENKITFSESELKHAREFVSNLKGGTSPKVEKVETPVKPSTTAVNKVLGKTLVSGPRV